MYLPTAKKTKQYKCVCGKGKTCKEISKIFQELGDVRGEYKLVPNPLEDTRKEIEKVEIDTWRDRLCTHFSLKKGDFQKLCYNKKKPTRATRQDSKEKYKQDVYVAMWHYHPYLLKKYYHGSDAVKEIPRTASLDEIKELNLYAVGGNFYSKVDVLITNCVVLVPNYINIEAAKADSIEAADKKRVYTAVWNAQNEESPKKKRAAASSGESTKASRRKIFGDNNPLSKSDEELGGMTAHQLQEFVRALQGSCVNQATELKQAKDELAFLQQGLRAQKHINECGDTVLCQTLTIENEKLVLEKNEIKMAGLNRMSMSNSKFFSKHKRHCKDLYGFPDFDYLKGFIEEMLDVEYITPSKLMISAGGKGGKNGLSEFEQVLLTLFFTNTTWNYDTIGSVFGVTSRVTVGGYISKWMPLLGELGEMLSSFTDFLDADALDKLEPEWYIKLNLRKIVALVDGKDFLCETCRKDRVLNCAQSSNKVNHSAFRILTWSLPCGAVIQRTPAFFGRASEKAILRAWGALGRLKLPRGYCILGDKGFDNTAGSYTNYNTTLHPSFLTNDQFSRDEVNHNIEICKKRYTCETVYSRVTQLKKLSGVLPRESFHHFEDMVAWGHGLANVCYGYLQKIHEYDH